MKFKSKKLDELFEEYAKENDMSPEEVIKEVEDFAFNNNLQTVANNISIYLDRRMLLPTKSRQRQIWLSVMAGLLDNIVSTKYTLYEALADLEREYKKYWTEQEFIDEKPPF